MIREVEAEAEAKGDRRSLAAARSLPPRCLLHVACRMLADASTAKGIGGPPHALTSSVPHSLHEGLTRSLLYAASRSALPRSRPLGQSRHSPDPFVRSGVAVLAHADLPSLLCPALPFPALPCPAVPCPALPCPALPCPALPCPALPCPALPCPSARPAAKFCSRQRPASPSTSAHAEAAARADASASASASSSRSGTGDFPSSDWSAIEDAAPLHAAPDASAAAGGAAADVCRTRRGASDDCTNAVIIGMHWHEWCELRVACCTVHDARRMLHGA
jgi:hypothetical protein